MVDYLVDIKPINACIELRLSIQHFVPPLFLVSYLVNSLLLIVLCFRKHLLALETGAE